MDLHSELQFCISCLCPDHNNDSYSCLNCGSCGSLIKLRRWQIDEICRNASWVGKRRYPTDEDIELAAEIKELRQLAAHFLGNQLPGRKAIPPSEGMDSWMVSQDHNNKLRCVFVNATDENDALKKAVPLLPFVPKPRNK